MSSGLLSSVAVGPTIGGFGRVANIAAGVVSSSDVNELVLGSWPVGDSVSGGVNVLIRWLKKSDEKSLRVLGDQDTDFTP